MRLLVPLIALAAPGLAAADTVLMGDVGGQTWTAAGNPYVLTGDVRVAAGTVLHIEPGVLVQPSLVDGANLGEYHDEVEILVDGTLDARGTATAPIGISSSDARWGGVALRAGSEGSVLEHVTMRWPYQGVFLDTTGAGTRLSYLTITDASFAVDLVRGTLTADHLLLEHNATGVLAGADNAGAPFTLTVTDSVIRDNSLSGVIEGGAGTITLVNDVLTANLSGVRIQPAMASSTTITSCTIAGNRDYGVDVISAGVATVDIVRSIVSAGDLAAIRQFSHGVVIVHDSIVDGQLLGTVMNGGGMMLVPPGFVSATDRHLAAGSPAIDVALDGPDHDVEGAARPLDGDGDGAARWDLGAYERATVLPLDAGVDAPIDAPVDAAVDAALPDAAPPDAGPIDARPVDAAAPDAATPAADEDGGCCSTGRGRDASLVLAIVVVAALRRRRRLTCPRPGCSRCAGTVAAAGCDRSS